MNVKPVLLPRMMLGVTCLLTGSAQTALATDTKLPVEALLYSTMPSTRDHRPEFAFDGDPHTSFETKGGMSDGDEFRIILSHPVNVKSITVDSGDEDGNDRLVDAILEASADGITFRQLAQFSGSGSLSVRGVKSALALRIRPLPTRGVPKLCLRDIRIQSDSPITHVQYGPGRGFTDLGEAPDLTKWAETAERQMESFWMDTAAILYSFGLITPNMVHVVYKTGPGVTGVAATGGGVMTVNSKWAREHPDDTGLTVHEMAHVVQSINAAAPGWLVEGTADYIRWVKFEPEHFHPRINMSRATYHDAYQTSATFLGWCALHYDSQIITKLNDAARMGAYKNSLFVQYCGKDVDSLWKEFIEAYKAAPSQILAVPAKPGMSPRAVPQVTAGSSLSIDLSSLFSVLGIGSDQGRTPANGGFDGEGNVYPASYVGGTKIFRNVSFKLAPPNKPNAVPCKGNTIPLSGKHRSLWLLAAAIEGAHKELGLTLHYSDGSNQTVYQNFSDWYVPEGFPGEARAIRSEFRVGPDGSRDGRPFFVYGYGFNLDPTKEIKSVSLPNDEGVRLFAVTLAD